MDKMLKRRKLLSAVTGLVYCLVQLAVIPLSVEDAEGQITASMLCVIPAFLLYGLAALRWHGDYKALYPKSGHFEGYIPRAVKGHPELSFLAGSAYKWLALAALTFIGNIIRMSGGI